jgi:polyphenol oxidase
MTALPQPSGEFEWVQAPWGAALRCRAIGAPHLFSTRALELRGNDEGWRQLASALGVDPGDLIRPKQVHGNGVLLVPSPLVVPAPNDGCASTADIITTRNAGVAVAVQAADCVPLLFLDSATGAVAAAHAGWRGTAAGVAQSATRAMAQHFGTRAGDLVVAIGPSIGPCCYRVGDDLLAAFGPQGRRWFYRLADGWVLNLWTANRDQLVDAGVRSENIHVAELCTAMQAELFDSFRRDGASAGRMAAAIRSAPAEEELERVANR